MVKEGEVYMCIQDILDHDVVRYRNGSTYQCDFDGTLPSETGARIYITEENFKSFRKIFEKWVPKVGDVIRKKGTQKPLFCISSYCVEYLSFWVIEERSTGIAGGTLSCSVIESEYELVRRTKKPEEFIDDIFKNISSEHHETDVLTKDAIESLVTGFKETDFSNINIIEIYRRGITDTLEFLKNAHH